MAERGARPRNVGRRVRRRLEPDPDEPPPRPPNVDMGGLMPNQYGFIGRVGTDGKVEYVPLNFPMPEFNPAVPESGPIPRQIRSRHSGGHQTDFNPRLNQWWSDPVPPPRGYQNDIGYRLDRRHARREETKESHPFHSGDLPRPADPRDEYEDDEEFAGNGRRPRRRRAVGRRRRRVRR